MPLNEEENLTEEQKEEIRAQDEYRRIEEAAREWDPERETPLEHRGESHKTVICYNPSCPDYRIERPGHVACACKRTRIQGGGV